VEHTAPSPASRVSRLAYFIWKMFLPLTYVPTAIANFALLSFALQALQGRAPLQYTWRSVAGTLSVLFFMLLLRVYDELKDVEVDLRLGRAGDPRYRDRPIVTGQIRVEDLEFLKRALCAALVALNLPMGSVWPLAGFTVFFTIAWLSSRWFFWAPISKSLLLAFLTHNPMLAVLGGYVFTVTLGEFGPGVVGRGSLPLLLGFWLPVAAWETSRKIRRPEDETSFETYSKVFGWKVAPFVPVGFALGATACLSWVARETSVSPLYPLALALATVALAAAAVRFRAFPSTRSAKLQPYAEAYVMVAMLGLPLALALRHGVVFVWRGAAF
jgi:hypothetical protein